jgi:hypothetical protein
MKMQTVDFYLPKGEKWYNYDKKTVDNKTGVMRRAVLYDQE